MASSTTSIHEPEQPRLGAGIDFTDPNSRLAAFYLQTSHIVAVVLLGALFVLLSHLPIWHTDIWGHMRFGESIVVHRALPTREVFSGPFADQDALYVNYQWIAQAGAYLAFELGRSLAQPEPVHRLGGGALMLAAAHAALVTLRMFLLLAAFRRLCGSLGYALAGVLLVIAMGMFCHLLILRPQVLGEVGMAAVLLALSAPLTRRTLFWLPPVFVLWANSHGSFPIGMVVLCIALTGQAISSASTSGPGLRPRQWIRACWQDEQVRRLALVIVLSLLAIAVLNPHGPKLFLYSFQLSNQANIQFMEEWKPLPLKSISGLMFLGSILLLAALLRWSPRPFTPTQILLLTAFGWQSLAHSRMLVWWIMIFAWVAVPHLQAAGDRYLARLLPATSTPSLRKTILAGFVATVMLLWSGPAQWLLWGDRPVGARRVTSVTPLAASAYLKNQYRRESQLKRSVFASETMGDYLMWDLRLEPPVYVASYTHVHLFTEEHWRDCMLVKSGDRGWQQTLDRMQAQFLVVEPDLHARLVAQVRASSDWQVISTEPVFVAKRKGM